MWDVAQNHWSHCEFLHMLGELWCRLLLRWGEGCIHFFREKQIPSAETSVQQEIPKKTLELNSPVTLSYGNFNIFLWILEETNVFHKQFSVSQWQRREVFVILVLVMGFPSEGGEGDPDRVCYSNSGDSSGSSQRKSRRIWEGSCWLQDLGKQPHAQRTLKLRFPWWYWFWDICLREGSNGEKVRKEWKKRKFFWWVSGQSFPIVEVILSMKCEQICQSKLTRTEK